MHAVRKIIKAVAYIVLILVGYIGIVLLTSIIPVNNKKAVAKEYEIYILTNGVHTDIVLPIQSEVCNWLDKIPLTSVSNSPNAKFIAMGWGDKGFYLETPTWADLKLSTACKAATGISTSAMHCTFYGSMKEGERCKKIFLSREEYQNLVHFVQDSFQQKSNDFIKINTNAVYGERDVFYEANGSYSLFYTCNTWANQALKAANQKAALWTVFDFGIFYHYT